MGERPAAGGADKGVEDDLVRLSTRGVNVAIETEGLKVFVVDGTTLVVRRGCLHTDTSLSKAARLRLMAESIKLGSMFSESDNSGEGARLLRLGAELGVRAVPSLVWCVTDIHWTNTILPVLYAF